MTWAPAVAIHMRNSTALNTYTRYVPGLHPAPAVPKAKKCITDDTQPCAFSGTYPGCASIVCRRPRFARCLGGSKRKPFAMALASTSVSTKAGSIFVG